MRSIWSLGETYAARLGSFKGWALQRVSGPLRRWDRRAAQQVSAFAANSAFVRERIARSYAREARVIHPPVAVPAEPPARRPEDFYLMVGEMVEYKRTDLGVEACKRLGRPLVVVGDGPEGKRLRAAAGPEAVFLGRVSDEEIRQLLARCRALLFCAEEDFGIVPVEAMGAGCPVIAYGVGGAVETVVDGETGLFFRHQTVDDVMDAVERFERMPDTFEPQRIHARAAAFAYPAFEQRFTAWVDECVQARADRHG
jgi:glycosyltransferase involved in cell wall biosynthesis